jgi:hypothetical protein
MWQHDRKSAAVRGVSTEAVPPSDSILTSLKTWRSSFGRKALRPSLSWISEATATHSRRHIRLEILEVRHSCSHQQVVHCEFGWLKFLVRSETDGYANGPGLNKPNVGEPTEPLSLDDALGIVPLGPSVVDAG